MNWQNCRLMFNSYGLIKQLIKSVVKVQSSFSETWSVQYASDKPKPSRGGISASHGARYGCLPWLASRRCEGGKLPGKRFISSSYFLSDCYGRLIWLASLSPLDRNLRFFKPNEAWKRWAACSSDYPFLSMTFWPWLSCWRRLNPFCILFATLFHYSFSLKNRLLCLVVVGKLNQIVKSSFLDCFNHLSIPPPVSFDFWISHFFLTFYLAS